MAIVDANDIGDIVVWYASVKGGDSLLVILVCQILTRLAEYLHHMYIGRACACICVDYIGSYTAYVVGSSDMCKIGRDLLRC